MNFFWSDDDYDDVVTHLIRDAEIEDDFLLQQSVNNEGGGS